MIHFVKFHFKCMRKRDECENDYKLNGKRDTTEIHLLLHIERKHPMSYIPFIY